MLLRERYEPLEVIGKGGQGEVIRARDTIHDRTVALKARHVTSDTQRETLLSEARILLTLRPHHGVPLVREDFFEGDRYYLVMDWVEGSTLRQVLAEHGPFTLDETIRVLHEVAVALDHLHAHAPPIVHRDVKPANIIVTPGGAVVLVDFGIAAGADGHAAAAGTPGYVSPELLGGGPVSAATDVFGLAATAFALLTGEPPRPGKRPRFPGLSRKQVALVMAALERGLAFDPTRRPQHATGFVASMRSGPAIPNNLPEQATSFVGRDAEAGSAAGLLEEGRVVTLTGPGGIGKTRLALHVAARTIERYGDGAWLVELAPVSDPGLVATRIAAAVGVAEEPGIPVARTVLDHLRARRALLVLDNCEHVLDAAAAMVDEIVAACPGVTVLATSREPLRASGEAMLLVPPLPVVAGDDARDAAAVRLFIERAERARPGSALDEDDLRAVASICTRLDGIPLAIELAAARTSALGVGEIAERLDDRFGLLRTGRRAALPRQQTLRATVDWSYDMLGPDQRAVFARLSVFAGGFTLAHAEAVCAFGEVARDHVVDLVASLVDRSLLMADGAARSPRYRMLETIRGYAQERLTEAGDAQQAATRHRDAFASLADAAAAALHGPEHARWLDRLETEHDNVRRALATCFEHADAPGALRLATAMWRFWETRGHLTEGRALLERATAMPDAPGDLRARALKAHGGLAQRLGDLDAARASYSEALALAREAGDGTAEADCLHNLGGVAWLAGDHATAMELTTAALGLRRTAGDARGTAFSLANLGVFAMERGDYAGARASLTESLSISHAMGDQASVADASANLGVVAEALDDLDDAVEHYTSALAMRRSLGDVWGIANALGNLAGVRIAQGAHDDAIAMLDEALTLLNPLDDRRESSHLLLALSRAHLAAGDRAAALTHARRSLEIRAALGDLARIAGCLETIAEIELANGRLERAATLASSAASLREAAGIPAAPSDRSRLDATIAEVEQRLAPAAFQRAWQAGADADVAAAARGALEA